MKISNLVYLYLVPAIVCVVVFFVFPLSYSIIMSLTKWDGVTRPSFIGITNYVNIFTDRLILRSLFNTLFWILGGFLIHIPLGLVIALILSRHFCGWAVLRTLIFLPNTFSIAALAIIWYFLLHPSLGLVHTALVRIGLGSIAKPWLAIPQTALLANMLPFLIHVGITVFIFLAHIESIPKEYYEAAKLDGANQLQLDLFITIPLLRRALAVNCVLNAAFALKMVEYPLIMTGGGPAGATYTLSLYMYYQMSKARNWGGAMAIGVVLLIIGLLFELGVFKRFKMFKP